MDRGAATNSPKSPRVRPDSPTDAPESKRPAVRYAGFAANRTEKLDRHAHASRDGGSLKPALLRSGSLSFMPEDHTDESFLQARKKAKDIIKAAVECASSYTAPKNTRQSRPFDLTAEQLIALCRSVQLRCFSNPASVVEVIAPAKVFGDIHGQVDDLVEIFRQHGRPCAYHGDVFAINYIFNGDFVDRGSHSLEVVAILFSLKLMYGPRITLIRGNHELRSVNRDFGLYEECVLRYGLEQGKGIYEAVNIVFDYLPLAAVLQALVPCPEDQSESAKTWKAVDRILVLHGGIGSSLTSLSKLREIKIPLAKMNSPILSNIFWNDPAPIGSLKGYTPNARGHTVESFGSDVVVRFCKTSGIDAIIRSHECVDNGYEFFAGGMLLTVFSARNYCGVKKNHGAVILVTNDITLEKHASLADQTEQLHTPTSTGSLLLTPLIIEHVNPGDSRLKSPMSPSLASGNASSQTQNSLMTIDEEEDDGASDSGNGIAGGEKSASQPRSSHERAPSPTRQEKKKALVSASGELGQARKELDESSESAESKGKQGNGLKDEQNGIAKRSLPQELESHRDIILKISPSFKRDSGIDSSDVRQIQECFQRCCLDGSDSAQPEMTLAMFARFFEAEKASLYCLAHVGDFYRAIDTDGNGSISVEEFVLGVLAMRSDIPHDISSAVGYLRLMFIFRFYNKSATGFLTPEELDALIEDVNQLDQRKSTKKDANEKLLIAAKVFSKSNTEKTITFADFNRFVQLKVISGTSILFRFLSQ